MLRFEFEGQHYEVTILAIGGPRFGENFEVDVGRGLT